MNRYWLSRGLGAQAEGPFFLRQLRTMFDVGQLTAEAQVCREGEEGWFPLHEELEHVTLSAEHSLPSVVRKEGAVPVATMKRGNKSGVAGCFLLIIGVILLLAAPPVGIVAILAALVVDHLGLFYCCGGCGNEVSPKAQVCGVCCARLKKPWWRLY